MLTRSVISVGEHVLVYVNLNQRYPGIIQARRDREPGLIRSLAEITLGDWFRFGRNRAERVTAMAGVYFNRIVTVFPAKFDPKTGYDPHTERYSFIPGFLQLDPADSLAGLLNQHLPWGRGNPSFKDATDLPAIEAGDVERRMLQVLDRYAEPQSAPTTPRPQEHDPLLSRVHIEHNPRGGVVVSVPTGTNVLIKNT